MPGSGKRAAPIVSRCSVVATQSKTIKPSHPPSPRLRRDKTRTARQLETCRYRRQTCRSDSVSLLRCRSSIKNDQAVPKRMARQLETCRYRRQTCRSDSNAPLRLVRRNLVRRWMSRCGLDDGTSCPGEALAKPDSVPFASCKIRPYR